MMVHRNAAMRFRKPRKRPEPVEVIRVDPRILKTALRIAKGDASRLRIISATKVEVEPRCVGCNDAGCDSCEVRI